MKNLNELLQNEELMIGLAEVSTPAQLEALFTAHGLTLEAGMTYEQALEILQRQKDGELTEEDLDAVSGGIAVACAVMVAGCVVVSALWLSLLGYTCHYMYTDYKTYKKRKKEGK